MTAIILCAGHGTRLGELTNVTPKPLINLGGTTPVEYLIKYLNSHGITKILINVHHLFDLFPKVLGGKVIYSYEPELLGTAGTLQSLQKWMSDDYVVMNGDTLSNFPLEEVLEFHHLNPTGFTAVVSTKTRKNAGLFIVNRNKTKDWWKKGKNIDDILAEHEYSKFETQNNYLDMGTPEKLEEAKKKYAVR